MAPFDINQFIVEIEARPAIWNPKCPKYSNKIQRGKAWEEICQLFTENYAKMDTAGKSQAAAVLQRKWKSLKDCFNREINIMKKIKNGKLSDTGKKQYIYFRQLSFLMPLKGKKSPEPSENESQEEEVSIVTQTALTPRSRKRKRVSEKNQIPPLQRLVSNIEKMTMALKEKDDPDRHFLMSLLPHYKTIPEHAKLDVQVEIINLIKGYQLHKSYSNY